MYASFFGLRELPFNNTPDPRFFYSTPDHEEALASLIYAISESKGFVLLTGEVGAGKTLVTRLMQRHFNDEIVFAGINHTRVSSTDLLRCICDEFRVETDPHDTDADLIRRLQDFLVARFADGKPVVLMLDEAQALSRDAFEQVRMIGNVEADDAKLLQIVIVGQPELRERFEVDDMRQLRQRIFRSFHLRGLTRAQTEGYVRHRLSVGGAQYPERIFDNAAMDVIHEYSQGLPRLINTVCDNAMLSAYAADQLAIDGPFVERVIEQMTSVLQGGPQYASPRVHVAGAKPRPVAIAPTGEHVVERDRRPAGSTADLARAAEARTSLEQCIERSCAVEARLKSDLLESTDALHGLVTRAAGLHQRLRVIIDEAEARIDRVADRANRIENGVCAVIDRLDGASRRCQPLVGQLRRQAEASRGLIEEMKVSVDNTQAHLAATDNARQAVDEASSRLTLQTTRSTRLTGTLRKAFNRLERQSAVLQERATGPGESAGRRGSSSGPSSQLLERTRSLADAIDQNRATITEMCGALSATTGVGRKPKEPLARSQLATQISALNALIDESRRMPSASD